MIPLHISFIVGSNSLILRYYSSLIESILSSGGWKTKILDSNLGIEHTRRIKLDLDPAQQQTIWVWSDGLTFIFSLK